MKSAKRGFTLVELLVVIAIISVLAAMLLPALENAIASTYKVTCANRLKQMYMGSQMYMNDFDSWMPGHYAFGRNTPSSTSATTANAYREYWPDEVRSCPTNEMSTALKSSNGFYQHYMYPLGQFYTEAKSYIHPSGVVVPGYVRMVKATASAALGQIKPFGTLPLISDPCYYYAPTGGMNFTAHANGSGQVPIGWNVPFMMPEGQNSAWLDGHVEWNNTPAWWTRFADCTEAYNTVMVPTNSFQEGWTRLYGSRWVTWTKK